ncbi:hypothetical protein [Endobacterium cereale]|uniref:hypothetical protein n=1 Tax=Endobacterium cereale TaxID=2663029 RepID=UPI002B477BD5|nr:hypothetical protein [Endobacterium cereale]MEB2845975.1 hypothetical protein [Endobacterium cereale]
METQPHLVQGSSPVLTKIFYPQHTVRCVGPASFRSQTARDAACLLDVDEDVVSWTCFSEAFHDGNECYRPDLVVEREHGLTVLDVGDGPDPVRPWLAAAVRTAGFEYQVIKHQDLPAIRLRNARDLLRYARYEVTLDDRIRLLAALDDHGSLTVGETMSAFRGTPPISALASLVLSRIITIDIDDALIGPETIVRRYRG